MKHIFLLLILCFLMAAKANSQFAYLNPRPNSSHHNPQITFAIKNGDLIEELSLHKKEFIEIKGSLSGNHTYTARLSDDGKTIVVRPHPIFDYGETVSVTIHSNRLKTKSGKFIEGVSYSFDIRDAITPEQAEKYKQAKREFYREGYGYDPGEQSDTRDENIDSLPTYTVTTNNNAAPGQFFFRNKYTFVNNDTNCFATIVENDGSVTWARDMGTDGNDFKINHNGYITYFNNKFGGDDQHWTVLDSNYNVIDTFSCGNGYGGSTNSHDMTMYPDGHALLLVSDERTMDLTQYGGKVDAAVTGVMIQELDAARDVIWQWDGFDYFNVTDAIPSVPITTNFVDYVHANAVSRDYDGNIILSSRHMNEVTKINRETGDLIWRLNGENNQFTFVNDNIPEHFSRQHDAYRLANGNIMLYNNGVSLSPLISSSKEYHIDEVNKIATLKWFYEHPDVNGFKVYGSATGSSQRLPNGNTVITWGSPSEDPLRPTITEVDSNKNIVWEMNFDQHGQACYRVHKYVWKPCEMPRPDQIVVKKITDSTAKINWGDVNNAVTYDCQYRKKGNNNWKLKTISHSYRNLKGLKAGKTYEYQVRTNCANGYTSDWTPIETFTTLPERSFLDEQNVVSFNLYPNPASTSIYLEVESGEIGPITFSVYDLSGKIIFSSEANTSGETLKFDVSALTAGIYLAQIKMQTQVKTIKFTKE